MRTITLLLTLFLVLFSGCENSVFSFSLKPGAKNHSQKTLVVYTYDSMVAEGGLGPAIFPLFEQKCRCQIKPISAGDAGQILSRVQLDEKRGKPTAHLVMGIDQNLWPQMKPHALDWKNWKPAGYDKIAAEFQVDSGFLPFDYGVVAFMADTRQLKTKGLAAPESLRDLLNKGYRKNLIIEDPRTSSPGLAFLLYTYRVFGEAAWEYWKALKDQPLTLTPSWDDAYNLFLREEAPLVWSYSTSQAYHRTQGDQIERYQALMFKEGNPYQIEGAALVNGAFKGENGVELEKLAKRFLEFLISKEAQEAVPTHNWMLPVVQDVTLPPAFQNLPPPKSLLKIDTNGTSVERLLNSWAATIRS